MKKVFFTPGPTELFFTYQDHLRSALDEQFGSISHRSPRFQSVFQSATEQLKELLRLPDGYRLVFTTSATECWERITQNLITVSSHHYVNGDFGQKFHKVSKAFGRDATISWIDENFDPEVSASELIGLTMNETSTGFQLTNDELKAIRNLNPEALIALDCVSAAPAIDIDFSFVDTAYFSVQKCFGMPPGLGVWIVNEKAIAKAEKANQPSYHSLPNLIKQADKNQNPCTPNSIGIYILGKIAEDMNRRGAKAIRSEINYKSALLYQTLEGHEHFELSIQSKKFRSKTVSVANCSNGSAEVIEAFKEKGMFIGSGYSDKKSSQIRIANFPTHSKEQVELLCDSLVNFS